MSQEGSRWRSYHLYYHGEKHLLLTLLVRPLVASLLEEQIIDHLFFIHYELGGPQVRLRLRVAAEAARLDRAVAAEAQRFFSHWPSRCPLPAEAVRRRTREILAADASESDAAVHPDNSLQVTSFVPEVERYGGPERIGCSLDFFALSSVRALSFAEARGAEPRARQIPGILRALAAQAFGFARDGAELLDLLGYAAVDAAHPFTTFMERGDRAFEKEPEAFRSLLQDVLASGGEAGAVEEARRLAARVHDAPSEVRWRILKSHMHMTANRMGLRNPEETYLTRILWRAAHGGGGLDPVLREAWSPETVSPEAEGETLESLLPAAFSSLMDRTGSSARPTAAVRRS